jgi:transcriptional regulator with XRE-family HTH domain
VPALSLYVRTLVRATRAAGSPEELAEALGVSVQSLELWLLGEGEPPSDIFLKAVALIVISGEPGAQRATRRSARKRSA